ncbi:ras guanine nucleotide exchange factor domain-containing protein [Halteromyces radiatus]|uniref:ras guanine nucleotide exchange factor domain-containing protein n=1 Tax=Halteromyces radiatus TaxID=101107 RepID=UPI00221FEE3A|nr:ras guanine nucleotide exchange factor domain-containing protein [Halteromyces radiatus]KAI8081606.1 ras guanine nucleotide exchange factor domain-containing protein [Halteromyces radiatus]
MEEVQSSLTLANQMEEKGQVKDAYFAYLSLAQDSLTFLKDIKFIQSSIISQPKQYSSLITAMRTCLSHMEHIIETHTPGTPARLQPQHTGDSQKFPKPPLPPKPSRIHKPVLPPKPVRGVVSRPSSPTNDDYLQDKSSEQSHQSNLQQPGDSAPILRQRPPTPNTARPYSVPSPDNRSLQKHRPFTELRQSQDDDITIVSEGEVDPTHLVPAQTNVDGLNSSISGQTSSDHVPLIPAPPLLITHRILQTKLDDLELSLKETKARKQQLLGEHHTLDPMTEDDINHRILQYSRQVADTKQTLNRVRTIYMSAATIPTIIHFKAHITAYQVTQIEAAIFNAIPPSALLSHSAKHPHPRIVASTDFFNYITRAIEHSILFPQEASARAQLIHYWIKVASRCLELNNYQTLKAIVSALGTPPVERLRRTWAYIPKKSVTKLDTLSELMSESDNYGRYREHMGMVNTTVVNGKSVAQIRAEHFTKPTVPFLGTFIHDITYLLAAFKSSSTTTAPQDEPRIHEVLETMRRFQQGPRYPTALPGTYNKAHQKHHFRPAISNALHRGASGIGRISSNGLFGFGSNSNSNSNGSGRDSSGTNNSILNGFGADDDDKESDESEDGNMEEQQEMVTQYVLMRPWVNQDTVDQLSLLREPPRQKTNTMSSGHRSSGGGQTSSVLSNSSSSMMRNSNGNISLNTNSSGGSGGREHSGDLSGSRPISVDDEQQYRASEEYTRYSSGSNNNSTFWPFRRSMDQTRPATPHEPTGSYQPSPTPSSSLLSTSTSASNIIQAPAPVVPPRPPNMTRSVSSQQTSTPNNDEFKAVLAQRLAKVATDTN